MDDRKYFKALVTVLVTGTVLTSAHMIYIYYAYIHSSIIYFISREIWP